MRERSPAIVLGTAAGIPESSKLNMSSFPAASLFMEIPLYDSGLVKVRVVMSAFVTIAFPAVPFSPSEVTKSTFAV